MTFTKRKKNDRQRASKTHGWGSMKKHRGKGNKGGAGRAGSGKRADTRKPGLWKNEKFGKKGFVRRRIKIEDKTINLKDIKIKLLTFLKEKKAEKKQDTIEIDLQKIGYDKLLATGNVIEKYLIKVNKASNKAIEKIKNKGGEVILLGKEKEKKPVEN